MVSRFLSAPAVPCAPGGWFESFTSSGVVVPSFFPPAIVLFCDSPNSLAAASNSSTLTPSPFVGAYGFSGIPAGESKMRRSTREGYLGEESLLDLFGLHCAEDFQRT